MLRRTFVTFCNSIEIGGTLQLLCFSLAVFSGGTKMVSGDTFSLRCKALILYVF